MIQFVWQNELTINSETNGGYYELHNGLKANKLCAHIIYNKLIDESYLDLSKIQIDWEWYKDIKFIKPKLL